MNLIDFDIKIPTYQSENKKHYLASAPTKEEAELFIKKLNKNGVQK